MSFEVELNAATLMLFRDLNTVREFLTLVEFKVKRITFIRADGPEALEERAAEGSEDDQGRRSTDVGWNDGELKPMMSTYQKIILIHGQTTPLDTVPLAYQTSLTFPCS